MIYVDNTSEYPQRIYIPRDDEITGGGTTHVYQFQRKDYVINNNGLTYIYPDPGYDGITGGTISVYVPPATSETEFVGLVVTENGIYVPSGNTAYSGVTVNIDTRAFYDEGYADGYNDGYQNGHDDGFNEGYTSGSSVGYLSGYTDGRSSGYTDGYESGYANGFDKGYASGKTDGYQEGYQVGWAAGYVSGHTDGYAEGYLAGLADGADQQKAKLQAFTATTNGEYTREDGWSAVTVSVPDGDYQDGYQDGVAHQKSLFGSYNFTANTGPDAVVFPDGISSATVNIPVRSIIFTASTNGEYSYIPHDYLYSDVRIVVDVPQTGITPTLASITVTQNGVYGPPAGADGISAVHAMFDTATPFNSGYTSGYTEGFQEGEASGETTQKSKLQAFTATTNGTWTREDGWSALTVNVNTAATYNSGYTDGYQDGFEAGLTGTPTANVVTTIYTNYKDGLPKTGNFDMHFNKQETSNGGMYGYTSTTYPYSAITSILATASTVPYPLGTKFELNMTPPTGFELQITPSASTNYSEGFVFKDGATIRVKLVTTLNITDMMVTTVSGGSAAQFTSHDNWNFECMDNGSDTYVRITSTGTTPGVYFAYGYYSGDRWLFKFHDGYPLDLGDNCFSGDTNIAAVNAPVSITKIGDNCFSGCTNLTSVTASNVTEVGANAFRDTRLSALTCQDLVVIGTSAFRNSRLATIDVSSECTVIGDYAFYQAPYLRQIRCYAVIPPIIGEHTFTNMGSANVGTNHICVPADSMAAYQQEWGPYLPSNWSFSTL